MGGGYTRAILSRLRNFLFVGSYGHLWYLPAAAIATLIVCWVVKKRFDKKIIVPGFLILYAVGLLGVSYRELLNPLESVPLAGESIRLYELVFVSTRNGFFFGSIFVGIGAIFAYKKIHLRHSTAIIGFIISMLLMLAEAFCVGYFDLAKMCDMYAFLLPAVFFLFYIATHIEIKETRITVALRKYSSIIFFAHMWVLFGVNFIRKGMKFLVGADIKIHSLLLYTMVAVGSLAVAIILVELQKHKPFKWLKIIM